VHYELKKNERMFHKPTVHSLFFLSVEFFVSYLVRVVKQLAPAQEPVVQHVMGFEQRERDQDGGRRQHVQELGLVGKSLGNRELIPATEKKRRKNGVTRWSREDAGAGREFSNETAKGMGRKGEKGGKGREMN
jgi:hypothetical protein